MVTPARPFKPHRILHPQECKDPPKMHCRTAYLSVTTPVGAVPRH
jgi:hypothetical protein